MIRITRLLVAVAQHPSARIIRYRSADNTDNGRGGGVIIKIRWPLYRDRVDGSWSRFGQESRRSDPIVVR